MAIAFAVGGAFPAAASGSYTCRGGSPKNPSVIPAGTYASITVKGFCAPADPGVVTVSKSLTVEPGATFFSLFGHARVTIGGSVDVRSGGRFALGCAPTFDVSCFDDPNATSHDTIWGNLSAERAELLIVHNDTIGGNVGVSAAGGLNCDNIPGLHTPGYVDLDSNVIGRNASVEGLRTCWSGFSNNRVGGNVSFNDNRTVIDDGNFVGGNTIARNLSCNHNAPRPHLSDFAPVPNSVSGHTEGQCVGEVA